MKVSELIKNGAERLKNSNIETYTQDAKVLAMYVLKCTYSDLIMSYGKELDNDICNHYNACIEKRSTHYPCQYITGQACFMGYDFYTSEGVLIPRPETELLVEEVLSFLDKSESASILDMCCGSGCIGISTYQERKKQGCKDIVDLSDVSDFALKLAKKNADKYNASCRIIESDLFESISGKYDVIASNPPYIRTSDIEELMDDVREYEPKLALDGGQDGLYFYREIIERAGKYLHDKGLLIFEIGYDQAEDIRRLLIDGKLENSFTDIEVIKDYAGLDRIVKAIKN